MKLYLTQRIRDPLSTGNETTVVNQKKSEKVENFPWMGAKSQRGRGILCNNFYIAPVVRHQYTTFAKCPVSYSALKSFGRRAWYIDESRRGGFFLQAEPGGKILRHPTKMPHSKKYQNLTTSGNTGMHLLSPPGRLTGKHHFWQGCRQQANMSPQAHTLYKLL